MKKTAIEKAIDQLDGEIAVLQAAKTRLQQQAQQPKPRKQSPLVTDGSMKFSHSGG